jgi:hypothetical protein
MGVTISYRGSLADIGRVEDIEDRVLDLALEVGCHAHVWRSVKRRVGRLAWRRPASSAARTGDGSEQAVVRPGRSGGRTAERELPQSAGRHGRDARRLGPGAGGPGFRAPFRFITGPIEAGLARRRVRVRHAPLATTKLASATKSWQKMGAETRELRRPIFLPSFSCQPGLSYCPPLRPQPARQAGERVLGARQKKQRNSAQAPAALRGR